MNIVAVIPARGGSKGVPRKNIKMIAGKPLIAWTIDAAKKSKFINKIIVTTDDDEIAEVSRKYGAEVLMRPKELAADEVPLLPVLKDVVDRVKSDIVVLLTPTSPIRDNDIIDRCIQTFLDKKVDNLATGFICKYQEYGTYNKNRQKLKGFFYDDGNVYVIRSSLIKEGKMIGKKVERIIIDREQNIEIDEPFDFWLAEQVLKKRLTEGKARL